MGGLREWPKFGLPLCGLETSNTLRDVVGTIGSLAATQSSLGKIVEHLRGTVEMVFVVLP